MAKRLKNIAPARSKPSDFRRKSGTRIQHPVVLIVCEGYKTEYNYFVEMRRSLDLDNTTVDIPRNDKGSAPISVVEYAKERYQNGNGYDVVFCVFDRDEHQSYQQALQVIDGYAKRKRESIPMRGIPSIPCFEYWVLLHFEQTDAAFANCADVIKAIKRHRTSYDKVDAEFFAGILPFTDDAIRNSKQVVQRQSTAGTDNPSTLVHEVVEYLRSIKDKL